LAERLGSQNKVEVKIAAPNYSEENYLDIFATISIQTFNYIWSGEDSK
jgi:hypothetical protein